VTADDLLGRRYEHVPGTSPRVPDFTVVAFDAAKGVYVHAVDGGRWWIPVAEIEEALVKGVLQESARPPFIFPRDHVVTRKEMAKLMKPIPQATSPLILRVRRMLSSMTRITR
jgi:hypothetical protein